MPRKTPPVSRPQDRVWLQQYRCGCFLEFARKRAVPGHCPVHLRDRQGPAIPAPADTPDGADTEAQV